MSCHINDRMSDNVIRILGLRTVAASKRHTAIMRTEHVLLTSRLARVYDSTVFAYAPTNLRVAFGYWGRNISHALDAHLPRHYPLLCWRLSWSRIAHRGGVMLTLLSFVCHEEWF